MSGKSHILSQDTLAVLLLCGSFTRKADSEINPLTVTQYNRLSHWLRQQELRPGDLLSREGAVKLRQSVDHLPEAEEALKLLARGVAMAMALENWTNQGIWVISRSEVDYPGRFKDRLKQKAPPLLFGAGNTELLARGGLAVIGSRHADETALDFSRALGRRCAGEDMQVISGGAKGVDQEAMLAALEAGGKVIGILADNLGRATVSGKYRQAIRDGRLALISACAPEAGFQVGNAMARNKLIYALSDYALVVCTEVEKGGTWAGALENLKHNWVPLLVRAGDNISSPNQRLLQEGGLPFDEAKVIASSGELQTLLQQALEVSQERKLPLEVETTAETAPGPVHLAESGEKALAQIEVDLIWAHQVWPKIAEMLQSQGRVTEKEVAEMLTAKKTQARAWLKRATEESKVEKLKNPVRYVIRQARQKSLLE